MWVEWSVGGATDLAERNPESPTGGEAYTRLLYEMAAKIDRRILLKYMQ
jgi:hypothetical protein